MASLQSRMDLLLTRSFRGAPSCCYSELKPYATTLVGVRAVPWWPGGPAGTGAGAEEGKVEEAAAASKQASSNLCAVRRSPEASRSLDCAVLLLLLGPPSSFVTEGRASGNYIRR